MIIIMLIARYRLRDARVAAGQGMAIIILITTPIIVI
jgi:hypothetical protein